MREIKLRAKSIESGEWVYGYYGIKGKDTEIEKHCIMVSTLSTTSVPMFYFMDIDVVPTTVGQFTGLKDRNGVEIYEGDIVDMHYFFENAYPPDYGVFEDERDVIGIVGINEMGTYTETEDDKLFWLHYLETPEEELEVIGNIYEQPELLAKIES